jgi:hypothetical protein
VIDQKTLFDSDCWESENKWDGNGQFMFPDAKIKRYPMQLPVQEFRLDDMIQEADIAFCELDNSPEFQGVSCFREQVSLAVDYMRSDGFLIHFSQIVVIFGVSKGIIIHYYQQSQQSQTERRAVGMPLVLDGTNWN